MVVWVTEHGTVVRIQRGVGMTRLPQPHLSVSGDGRIFPAGTQLRLCDWSETHTCDYSDIVWSLESSLDGPKRRVAGQWVGGAKTKHGQLVG